MSRGLLGGRLLPLHFYAYSTQPIKVKSYVSIKTHSMCFWMFELTEVLLFLLLLGTAVVLCEVFLLRADMARYSLSVPSILADFWQGRTEIKVASCFAAPRTGRSHPERTHNPLPRQCRPKWSLYVEIEWQCCLLLTVRRRWVHWTSLLHFGRQVGGFWLCQCSIPWLMKRDIQLSAVFTTHGGVKPRPPTSKR